MIINGYFHNTLQNANFKGERIMSIKNKHENSVTQVVREKYGDLAKKQIDGQEGSSCCNEQSACCSSGELSERTANQYSKGEINNLPESVTGISLGCGNPTAIANLSFGQTVLDLGSGGGIDCFLAAEKVGSQGHVIGLDMTPKMLDLARANAKKLGMQNVEFRYGYIEDIPLPDTLVNVIISNCVINLSADKDAVFRETYRVLNTDGVLNISDIVTYGDLPEALSQQLSAWVGCVSGALDEEVYLGKMREAGFEDIEITERKYYPPELVAENEGVRAMLEENKLEPSDLENKIASITLRAVKKG